MLKTLASLGALFSSMGILLLGGGLLGTLLAVRMGVEGVPSEVIGLVMACYSVGFVLATLVCAGVIQKVGHIRCFAAFAAMAACSALIHGLFFDPYVWAAMRILFGFSVAGLYMVTESWLNDQTPREFRGRVLSFYVITTSLALGSGQFLLGLWDVSGSQWFSLAAILLAAALVPVSLAQVSSPEIKPTPRVGLRQLYHISPLATFTAFSSGIINGGFFALGPVFAVAIGFSTNAGATFMGSAILGGLFLQYLIGRMSDRFDRRRVIMVVTAVVAAISLGIALSEDAPLYAVVGMAVFWGGFNFTVYALGLALAHDFMDADERVPASATLLLLHGAGMITGPIVLSQVMGQLGAQALFMGFAVIASCIALYGWYRDRVGDTIAVEQQELYQSAPQTLVSTPMSMQLDPLADEQQLEFDFTFDDEAEDEDLER
ncbi:MAG: MFS transporter [Ectothiorhodospiraceae bacterium]|nr:MFS transporter [Ectothiorhodospiraceae bacterium]